MIEVRNVSKRFGDTVAVDDLSFDVPAGVVTGFLGPNGAGKSTTMRMIIGLDRPSAGSVTIDGRAYAELSAPLHQVGALLDAKAIDGGRSARNHLRWVAQAAEIPMSRVDEVLDSVGLTEVAKRRVGGFSLGMSQRLGIATALLGDPQTLLFDEPVNGLDPDGILWIRTLLHRLASEGRAVLVSSHLMNEMEATADHVVVIGKGKLIADMSVAELTQRSSLGDVRVVSPDASRLAALLEPRRQSAITAGSEDELIVTGITAAEIGEVAARHGIRLHELSSRRPSLEAAFMELTRDSIEYRTEGADLDPADASETPIALTGQEKS